MNTELLATGQLARAVRRSPGNIALWVATGTIPDAPARTTGDTAAGPPPRSS